MALTFKYMKSWERRDIGDLKVLILHIPKIIFSSIFKKILHHSQKNIRYLLEKARTRIVCVCVCVREREAEL